MEPLNAAREAIDAIDRRLIGLLAERMQAVRDVVAYKREHGRAPLYDPERERVVFDFWASEGERVGLSSYFLGRVLREVLNWSRRDQERRLDRPQVEPARGAVRVGYQGAPASYSDLARTKLFASRSEPRIAGEPGTGGDAEHRATVGEGFESFGAVLDALEAGEIEYALLPIENTIAGSIHEVYGLLATRELAVVDEEIWHVEHALAGLPGARLEDVRSVRSHPVALQQCGRFLRGLVGVKAESWYDTAAAATAVAESGDDTCAAICSAEAARRAGLVILAENVADERTNITRFLLIARAPEDVDERLAAKTSLLLTVNHRHGALAECLAAFASEGLNLSKLESRPRPEAPWEYLFYVDVEGSTRDERLAAALRNLQTYTRSVRVLGSYPCRTEERPAPPASTPSSTDAEPGTVADDEARLAASAATSTRRNVRLGAAEIGSDRFAIIAGPAAVEGRAQILAAAEMARACGAALLRGGTFQPRTSPDSFPGLGFDGLELLVEAGAAFELPVVTEVLHPEHVDRFARVADVLQVGARNMQNFELLGRLGRTRRPVLLERGLSATIDELLEAAECVLAGGNHQVILCERGIRTFETSTRSTLDLAAVPVLRERTDLPVLVDPSHAAGRRERVLPLALAAAAAGADGLLVEAHPDPGAALCGTGQALDAEALHELRAALDPIVRSQGRTL